MTALLRKAVLVLLSFAMLCSVHYAVRKSTDVHINASQLAIFALIRKESFFAWIYLINLISNLLTFASDCCHSNTWMGSSFQWQKSETVVEFMPKLRP